ncbi:TonB-dependent receptor [Sinomicrobium pectinilyticum]|uniref:TonB-dependent receptor n=1 Tax=Sinomicrobium pectinilyticum TaxID=1084421 RepID=A0A3N0E5G7_SINP1|nr:TonB-dependent receptor [Sinomicrobium pectinilyticum]RNL83067.1 TonB-dependent receptor [Sinomicrobium pectinilyticum]
MLKNLFSVILISAVTQLLSAQSGTVTGKIMDGEFNDVLPFANIVVKGTTTGTTSDFDGLYSLDMEAGTHTLVFSFVGYETKEITGVEVSPDGTVELNVTLNLSSTALDEVVVTTTTRKNTEASVLNLQKNSVSLMDGLSSEGIKKTGASDIASAVKRVPGVSVQDGKYVYVRGLGDRYTKSILNGMDIPGLDPDKNTVQMDIFPTNILENLIVLKSASAELPADFTGGVVNIVTKDFPSSKQMSFSISGGFNPDMHFKDNYLSYEGGGTDFLGFDDGTRKLPISSKTNVPLPPSDNGTLEGITRSFDPNMAAQRENSMPNLSLSFSYGNQFDVGNGNKLGLIASVDYKNTTSFYEGFDDGIYQKWTEPDLYELRYDRRRVGDLGINNVLLSGLAGLSYKTERSKYRFNILHLQNGENQASLYNQDTQVSNSIRVFKNYLEYKQRSVTNLLFSGKHSNEDASFTTEWSVSPTRANVQDKDARLTTFIINNDGTNSISSDAGYPVRLWRDLVETNLVGKVDFTKNFSMFNRKSLLKFGGLYSYKQRDYSIYSYDIGFRAISTVGFNGDPDAILAPENIWTPETNSGSFIRGNFQPANTFDANQNTAALYVSGEFKPFEKLRAVIGLRGEYFTHFFTGQNNNGTRELNDEKVLDDFNLFPSANLIYELRDNMNLRGSYSRTIARPSFKEKSLVEISDLLTGMVFIGNLDLAPTEIDNIDLRWELFGEDAQIFAVSGFYKNFKNPIEIVAYDNRAPTNITPRNSPSAQVVGVEFEARKHLGFITEGLKNLSLNLNVSLIDSKIDMAPQEYEGRTNFRKEGETIDDTRELQGQSPYLINAGLNYKSEEIGLESGLFYNVQGKTLEVVGSAGLNPDVYTMPFNSLNFNFSKMFGKDQRSKISIKVDNLLDDDRESQYESFRAENQNFSFRAPGREFSIGYSYRF